ncbi:hypothetical protein DPMN_109045 [Dreissena polymorpha]|uniref:Uncharacterized protein n=1 Tax=Dreissena polymorpha TaxID=45954 RepID=A0A9D4K9V5_DREPO|nr:hypothetical protein DPMN_109045 [Dreissena polymorpha]
MSNKDSTSCTSLPCTLNRGRQTQKTPKRVQDLSYSSIKPKIYSVIDFNDPRGPSTVNKDENEVKDNVLWNLQSDGIAESMWNTILDYTYEDYEMTDVQIDAFKEWRQIFLENLKASSDPNHPTLLVEDQRCDRWNSERRVRLTASECHTVANFQS